MARPPHFRRTGHIGMSAEAKAARRATIGGSDAKIIMSGDIHAITQLWLEKRGEVEPDDLSEVVLIQLGNVTEPLNFDLFEKATGLWCTDEQTKVFSDLFPFMHATLDGYVRECETSPIALGIMDGKFMLPFNNWTIEGALEKHWAQLQHNMFVTETERAWLSVIKATGGYAVIECEADPFYQVEMVQAEERFFHCLQTGEHPDVTRVDPTAPKPEPVRIIDMTGSNEWAVHAQRIAETLGAAELHSLSKDELKKLFPDDAAVAHAHGVKLKRAKNGATLFEIEAAKAARQQAKDLVFGPTEKPRRSRAKAPALAQAA